MFVNFLKGKNFPQLEAEAKRFPKYDASETEYKF